MELLAWLLLGCGGVIIACNLGIMARAILKPGPFVSSVWIVGASISAAGLLLEPFAGASSWWWLPVVLDTTVWMLLAVAVEGALRRLAGRRPGPDR